MSPVSIRRVEQGDLSALLDIYNHYIVRTPITFDIAPKTRAERQAWLDGFAPAGRHQCFVAARNGTAIGWACSGPFRDKAAYQTSVETSVYMAPGETGQGLGRRLYQALFDALAGEDVHRLLAGVTLPNAASVGLHRAMGFQPVGTFTAIGRKFGRYWDVEWFERAVR